MKRYDIKEILDATSEVLDDVMKVSLQKLQKAFNTTYVTLKDLEKQDSNEKWDELINNLLNEKEGLNDKQKGIAKLVENIEKAIIAQEARKIKAIKYSAIACSITLITSVLLAGLTTIIPKEKISSNFIKLNPALVGFIFYGGCFGLFVISALASILWTLHCLSMEKQKSITEPDSEFEAEEKGKYEIEKILTAIPKHPSIKESNVVNKQIRQVAEATFDIQQKFQVTYVTLKDLERIRREEGLPKSFDWDGLIKKVQKKDSLDDNDKIKTEYLLQGIQQIIIDEEKRKTKLIKSAAIAFPILSIIAVTPLLAVAGAKKGIFKINNPIIENPLVTGLIFVCSCVVVPALLCLTGVSCYWHFAPKTEIDISSQEKISPQVEGISQNSI